MICLLRNIAKITPPKNGYECLPLAIEVTPGADLARIKFHRNELAHSNDPKMDENTFNTKWNEISGVSKNINKCKLLVLKHSSTIF